VRNVFSSSYQRVSMARGDLERSAESTELVGNLASILADVGEVEILGLKADRKWLENGYRKSAVRFARRSQICGQICDLRYDLVLRGSRPRRPALQAQNFWGVTPRPLILNA
jgi:hypothetical protein